jgi:hypothetical protein
MSGELLELVIGPDKALQARVTGRLQRIISASFQDDGSTMTRAEVKHRFVIVLKFMREFRREHGWAYERILDEAPAMLRSKLDGTPWRPALHRNSWGRVTSR